MRKAMKTRTGRLMLSMGAALLLATGSVTAGKASPEDAGRVRQLMQQQAGMMTPELQAKVKSLSPETKRMLMQILSSHNRYSDRVTLRQVMHEVLSDYQSMVAGVMTDNPEQAADSAIRIANHRIPVGGLLPYLGIENINDERLAVLESFNDSVEGNARKLAAVAGKGDMAAASRLMGDIAAGCVGCHAVFRGQPGVSAYLKK